MKIAVVGSINIDQSVETDRIPRKGETIVGQSLKYTPGGKGANQAVAMGRLGAEVVFFGCVGDDANGKARSIYNTYPNDRKCSYRNCFDHSWG